LSQREILLELRVDVKGIIEDRAGERVEVEKELAGKLGRAEFYKAVGLFLGVSGAAVGIMAALG